MTRPRSLNISEQEIQAQIMTWASLASGQRPELRLLYHTPNGGSRNKAEAARLRAAGVKAGVPDLFLPVPRGGLHGLYLELKAANGRTSREQREWMQALSEQGYAVRLCFGFDEAVTAIERYLRSESSVVSGSIEDRFTVGGISEQLFHQMI